MDDLTRNAKDEPCGVCYLQSYCFDKTRARYNYKLELWRKVLESKGCKLSRTKLNIWTVILQ